MLDSAILDALRDAVDAGGAGQPSGLITAANQLQTYECDGLTNFRVLPDAVVLPHAARSRCRQWFGCALCMGFLLWRAGRAPD